MWCDSRRWRSFHFRFQRVATVVQHAILWRSPVCTTPFYDRYASNLTSPLNSAVYLFSLEVLTSLLCVADYHSRAFNSIILSIFATIETMLCHEYRIVFFEKKKKNNKLNNESFSARHTRTRVTRFFLVPRGEHTIYYRFTLHALTREWRTKKNQCVAEVPDCIPFWWRRHVVHDDGGYCSKYLFKLQRLPTTRDYMVDNLYVMCQLQFARYLLGTAYDSR